MEIPNEVGLIERFVSAAMKIVWPLILESALLNTVVIFPTLPLDSREHPFEHSGDFSDTLP